SVGCDFEESGADFVRNRVQGLSFGVLFTSTAGPNKARLNAFVDPKFTGVYLLGSNTRATLDSNVYRLADASTMNSIAFVSTLASNAVTVTNSDFYPRAVFNTLVTQTDGGVVVQSGNFSADANKNPVLNGTFSANFFSPTSLFDKATANFPGFTP
ncbi:MAG: hypothetical protein KIS61_37470, partial [Candidatus Eremiobacteraeota bacterium]|nr:hypothetical protein [Candidatus Eremiobacteraeota bacterium]